MRMRMRTRMRMGMRMSRSSQHRSELVRFVFISPQAREAAAAEDEELEA
jgi:hypothetical protein